MLTESKKLHEYWTFVFFIPIMSQPSNERLISLKVALNCNNYMHPKGIPKDMTRAHHRCHLPTTLFVAYSQGRSKANDRVRSEGPPLIAKLAVARRLFAMSGLAFIAFGDAGRVPTLVRLTAKVCPVERTPSMTEAIEGCTSTQKVEATSAKASIVVADSSVTTGWNA